MQAIAETVYFLPQWFIFEVCAINLEWIQFYSGEKQNCLKCITEILYSYLIVSLHLCMGWEYVVFRVGIWKCLELTFDVWVNQQSFDLNDDLSLVVDLMETGEGVGRGAIIDAFHNLQQ